MKPKLELVPPKENKQLVVDEFGRLDLSIPWEDVRRHEALRKKIVDWYENSSPGSGFTADGLTHRVLVGPRSMKRRISSMVKVFQLLGRAKFLKACSFTMEALEGLLSGDEVAELVTEEQTGGRRLESVLIERQLAA